MGQTIPPFHPHQQQGEGERGPDFGRAAPLQSGSEKGWPQSVSPVSADRHGPTQTWPHPARWKGMAVRISVMRELGYWFTASSSTGPKQPSPARKPSPGHSLSLSCSLFSSSDSSSSDSSRSSSLARASSRSREESPLESPGVSVMETDAMGGIPALETRTTNQVVTN